MKELTTTDGASQFIRLFLLHWETEILKDVVTETKRHLAS